MVKETYKASLIHNNLVITKKEIKKIYKKKRK